MTQLEIAERLENEYTEIQEQRRKLYFREDGFTVINEVVDVFSANLPAEYLDLFDIALEYYYKESNNYLDFALHPVLIYTDKEKGVFVKILREDIHREDFTNDFKIFDAKLNELIKNRDEEMNETNFLRNVSFNSIVVVNDWLYFWRPDLGDNGYLIATDNDNSDIEYKHINYSLIQHIKSTKTTWNSDGFDFDTDFPDETYRF